MPTIDSNQLTHTEALDRLRAGNERFIANVRSVDALSSPARREALVAGQKPYAIILSCSDKEAPRNQSSFRTKKELSCIASNGVSTRYCLKTSSGRRVVPRRIRSAERFSNRKCSAIPK